MAWHTRFSGVIRGDFRDITVLIQEDRDGAPAEVLPLDLARVLELVYGDAGGLDEDPYGETLLPSSVKISVLDDDGEDGAPLFDALEAAIEAGEEEGWRLVVHAPQVTRTLGSGSVTCRAYAWDGPLQLSTLDRAEFPGIEGQVTTVEAGCGLARAKDVEAPVSADEGDLWTVAGRVVRAVSRIAGTETASAPTVRFVVGWSGFTPSPPAGPVATVEALRPGVAVYPDPNEAEAPVVIDPFDADGSAEKAGRPVSCQRALAELAAAFDCRVHRAITAQPDADGDPVPTTPSADEDGRFLPGSGFLFAHPWAHGVEVEQATSGYAPSSLATEEEASPAPSYVPPIALAAGDVTAPPDHSPRRRALPPALRCEVLRKARGGGRYGPPGYTMDPAFRQWDDGTTPILWNVVSGSVTRGTGIETQYSCGFNDPGGGGYTEITTIGPVVASGSRLKFEPRAYARVRSDGGSQDKLAWGLAVEDGATTYYLNMYTYAGFDDFPTGRFYWGTTREFYRFPMGINDGGDGDAEEDEWYEWRGSKGKLHSAIIAALFGLSQEVDLEGIPPFPASGVLVFSLFSGAWEAEVDSAELLMPEGVLTAVGSGAETTRSRHVVRRPERGLVGVGEVPWEQLVVDGEDEVWVPATRFLAEDGTTIRDDLATMECASVLEDRGLPGGGFVGESDPAPAALWVRLPVLVPPEQTIEYPADSGEEWRVGRGCRLDLVAETTEAVLVRCTKRFGATAST